MPPHLTINTRSYTYDWKVVRLSPESESGFFRNRGRFELLLKKEEEKVAQPLSGSLESLLEVFGQLGERVGSDSIENIGRESWPEQAMVARRPGKLFKAIQKWIIACQSHWLELPAPRAHHGQSTLSRRAAKRFLQNAEGSSQSAYMNFAHCLTSRVPTSDRTRESQGSILPFTRLGDIFMRILKAKESATPMKKSRKGRVELCIDDVSLRPCWKASRNFDLVLTDQSLGECLETLRQMEITDTLSLINALNNEAETDELNLLQKFALFYIRWFRKHCADDSMVAHADEYMLFSQLRARNDFNSSLICEWFGGLCDAFRHSRKGETKIAELLRVALFSVDEKLFKAIPDLLIRLAVDLAKKTVLITDCTRETYSKHIATFVTLEHTIFASFKYSGNEAKHKLRDYIHRPFMKLLRKIIRDRSVYYPFRYECKMIAEDLAELESGSVKSDTFLEYVRECFSCSTGQTPDATSNEHWPVENLQELFRDADIPSSWHAVISALHWVSLEVFHKPESYPVVEIAFDALDDNATLKSNKEARMAVRFGVLVQLRILATQGPNHLIQKSALDRMIYLAEGAEQNGYGDDTEIFEALLDTLVRVCESVQNTQRVHNAVARMANFKTTELRKAFDLWLGSLTIEERMNNSKRQNCQPAFQSKTQFAQFLEELVRLGTDQKGVITP